MKQVIVKAKRERRNIRGRLVSACLKNMAAILIALCMLAGCAPAAAPATVTEAPVVTEMPVPKVDIDLLIADALRLYEEGQYEEAILLYMDVIEIEPRNFHANLGLGKSQRRLGSAQEAIPALQIAYDVDTESMEAMQELCYAYIEDQRNGEAQKIAEEAWADGEGRGEAGLVLSVIAILEERYEDAAHLKEYRKVSQLLNIYSRRNMIYLGGYDEQGLASGEGVGVYSHVDEDGEAGMYVYIGQYEKGMRAGAGKWINVGYSQTSQRYTYHIFEGEWAEDAPNGYGVYTRYHHQSKSGSKAYVDTVIRSGNYINGLEDGEMTVTSPCREEGTVHNCSYTSVMGVRTTMGEAFEYADGTIGYWYTKCVVCNSGWTIPGNLLETAWGIPPWGEV